MDILLGNHHALRSPTAAAERDSWEITERNHWRCPLYGVKRKHHGISSLVGKKTYSRATPLMDIPTFLWNVTASVACCYPWWDPQAVQYFREIPAFYEAIRQSEDLTEFIGLSWSNLTNWRLVSCSASDPTQRCQAAAAYASVAAKSQRLRTSVARAVLGLLLTGHDGRYGVVVRYNCWWKLTVSCCLLADWWSIVSYLMVNCRFIDG